MTELAFMVVCFMGMLFVVQNFLVKPFRIPSESMVPTLQVGDRVLVNRLADRWSDPQVGQVVVFYPPAGAEMSPTRCGNSEEGFSTAKVCGRPAGDPVKQMPYIKRVVAVGGDTVAVRGGRLIRNGKAVQERYAQLCPDGPAFCDFPEPVKVPAGHLFMMGDNRGHSNDSRFWGPVPRSYVIGRAAVNFWPVPRVRAL